MAEALLSASLQVLFERLASPEFINLFRSQKHDERLLKKLKLKLLVFNKVLNDAENKQITDQFVKDWLDELKHAVYQADDLVDEIATQTLRCKVEVAYKSLTNQVQFLNSTSTSSFDAEIESKLKEVIEMLEDLEKQKDALGLGEVGQTWSHRLPTSSLVDEFYVCGRENDRDEIMNLLLSNGESRNQIGVIPIVGMGGVGKTTIAQLLYNDGIVNEHFDTKAWVYVSDVFEVLRITRTIVESVTGQTYKENDLNSLQVKLKGSLSAKKFLIVLDDVWNENYDCWNLLMTPLRFGAPGSRIIVTTRNMSVASVVKTFHVHRLQELQEEECWMLFAKHAFETGDCSEYPDLERIGREIVRKCRGLPLAAKTLGGLLRSQQDVIDWNNILKSAMWELSEKKSNIIPALRLSYHHLPSRLKRCFAYCSIFTKGYEFGMEKLVLIWTAEGLLKKPKSNKTEKEEGYECFRELLSRSFFQTSNANNSPFVMHDLIHDLAQSVMGDFCYRAEDDKPRDISEKLRHFSYVRGDQKDCYEKFKAIKEANSLRTFLPLKGTDTERQLSKKFLDEIFPGLLCLRLLSLSTYCITELPHSIGNMIHLRFLDLSNTRIRQLPKSLCTLYNLEILLLSDCPDLITLPADFGKLSLLRRLDLSETNLTEMPMHMSRLRCLEQLSDFIVGNSSGSGINELEELDHLCGAISISGLQNVTEASNACKAKIREKIHLETLTLVWGSSTDDSRNERDVLDALQPHSNLKRLCIKNYGGTSFSAWLGNPSFNNLVSLCLEKCEFCLSLPALGQLSSLKDLTIAWMLGIMEVGPEFYGDNGCLSKPFSSLETLHFEGMSTWERWFIPNAGEFSRLQKLYIIKCPKLTGNLPNIVPLLVTFVRSECPRLSVI